MTKLLLAQQNTVTSARVHGNAIYLLTTTVPIYLLENGELCLNSLQCKNGCCHRGSGLSLARCADKAAEFQECSRWHLTGIYYRCPCENGLSCEVDRTIIGTITNTDYGICEDPARKLYVEEKH
uniref:Colipase n=1 Tax=Podarcis muralis TaxID=64176 RepID=A0A670JHG0_PODMU